MFVKLDLNSTKVRELQEVPQNVAYYLQNYHDKKELLEVQKHYHDNYYRVWLQRPKASLKEVTWAYRVFNEKKRLYGVNLQPLTKAFYKKIEKNSNFTEYMKLSKKALTIRTTNIRAFPTDKMLFRDPNRAGEGFPFDYLQNSLISANKPIFVSHFSKDKKWAFIFSSFTSGWVKSRDIVFLDESDAEVWMKAQQLFIYHDREALFDGDGFLFELRIGMMLPLIGETKEHYTVVAATSCVENQVVFKSIPIKKDFASLNPLLFTKENIAKIVSQLQKSKYGWGGMFGERDCSSTMRDFFAPFGIWLGRNSSVQARVGEVIKLDGFSNDEKKEKILQEAKAFETLLYRKGHIGLYVGSYKHEPIVFQNLWGVKLKNGYKSGRLVIAKPIFSTLVLGNDIEYGDEKGSFLYHLKSFNIVTKE